MSTTPHERFAQALRDGAVATEAYATAGLLPREFDHPIGFYVYLLVNPIDDRVFYIGKGKGARALVHERNGRRGSERNPNKALVLATIRQANLRPAVHILADNLYENAAYHLERLLIVRAHAVLTNLMSGQLTADQRVRVEALASIAQLKPLCQMWREKRTPEMMKLWVRLYSELRYIANVGIASMEVTIKDGRIVQ